MIITKFSTEISDKDLLAAFKVIDTLMNENEMLQVDNSFIRVRNFLANCVCQKYIDKTNNDTE